MDRTFVEALLENAGEHRPHLVEGNMYVPSGWTRHSAQLPMMLRSSTLNSIRDFVKTNVDGLVTTNLVIHVAAPSQVTLMSQIPTEKEDWQRRRTAYLTAECYDGPVFGQWTQPEDFIVWLLSNFVNGGDRDRVLELVSTMKAENVRENVDDGYAQEVLVR